jgi:hypothetical protein
MARNPYIAVDWRQRAHRRAVDGWALRLGRIAVFAVAVGLLVPLVRPVFLGFLDRGAAVLPAGVEAVTIRAGLLLIALLSLDLYTALIRGENRKILDLHPVDEGQVAEAEMVRVGVDRAWLLVAFAVVLAPIAGASPVGYAAAIAAIFGCYLLGICMSAVVHLLAVDAATSERWAPILDLLRGHNPRAQAAFLYAPGLALAGAGLLAIAAAGGAGRVAGGDALGWLGVAGPLVAAVPCALVAPQTAHGAWFRASTVLADIDARYARHEHPDEARRVYLDWTVRFLPTAIGRYVLKDLRQGWRDRRSWITGAWLLGVGAALIGWSSDAAAPARSAVAVAFAVWLVGAVSVLMEADEPAFLRAWLPPAPLERRLARLVVTIGWLQGCLWPAVAASAVRHGTIGALTVLAVGMSAIAGASALGLVGGVVPRRGLLVYVPVAAVLAAGMAAWVGSA